MPRPQPPFNAPTAARSQQAPLDALLQQVRAQDYVQMLNLSGVPAPAAVRGRVSALREALQALCPEGTDAGAPEALAAAEVAQALDDAEAVLCCPLRGRLYAQQQGSVLHGCDDGGGDTGPGAHGAQA